MKKWLVRFIAVLALAIASLAAYAVANARGSERAVGFQRTQARDAQGRPFVIGLWYPTGDSPRPTTFLGGTLLDVAADGAVAGAGLPLVVLSHGNGGGLASHADLAMDLASAGYVVAAPMHAGDHFADQSLAGSPRLFSVRAQQLRATVDHVLHRWNGRAAIDARRIGAYGFSAGAFTTLTLIGARPDLGAIARQCAAAPEFVCSALAQAGSSLLQGASVDAGAFEPDPRVRAAVLAAPGLGFTLLPRGLDAVRVPVQLWVGEHDDTVPFATNGRIVRDGLGDRVQTHVVPGASHMSFLAPCSLLKPPGICEDRPGFDRRAFHADMNARVVRFFDASLATPRHATAQ